METILFDLDGTLADVSERRARLEADIAAGLNKNKALTRFHSAESIIEGDNPNAAIIELYQLYKAAGYHCLIVSGRKAEQKEASLQKLAEWGIEAPVLLCRERGDNRKDAEFKRELLTKLRAEGHIIKLAVDDQLEIAKIWREVGITCLDCAGFQR